MTLTSSTLNRRRGLALFAVLLALPLLSGCEYFDDVVVPAQDSTDPYAWGFIYQNGGYVFSGGRSFETNDRNKGFLTFATAMDHGGARRVAMHRSAVARYSNGALGAITHLHYLSAESVEQPGGPGDTVSNGRYVARYVVPGRQAPATRSGIPLTSITYTWHVEAEDMHGNVTIAPGGTLIYRP